MNTPTWLHPLLHNQALLSVLLTSGLFVFWLVVHLAASWIGFKRPDRAFATDTWLYRERTFERQGRIYERLGIKSWKQRLPEGDALVKDGFRKKHLPPGRLTAAYVNKFCVESRRAEWVHWLALVPGPLFFFGGHVVLGVSMTAYALLANLPCIIAQRYNRQRLQRMQRRHEKRLT